MKEAKKTKGFKDLLFEVILPKVELISLILISIGVLFKILKLQGTNELFMISMSTYAMVCYLSGFKKTNFESNFDKALIKFGGIASAVLVIGTLFLILKLPGAREMFSIGAPAFIIASIVTLIRKTTSESEEYKFYLKGYFKTFGIVTTLYLLILFIIS